MPLFNNYARKQSPSAGVQLASAIVMIVASVVFLDIGYHRVTDLHAAHGYVNPLRYLNVAFWSLLLIIWIYIGLQSFRRYRTEGKVV